MPTWEEYKDHVRADDPEMGKQIDLVEACADVIGMLIVRRNELGLSQKDLAEKCGMSYSAIARMESGESRPKLDTLITVCRALGLRLTAAKDV